MRPWNKSSLASPRLVASLLRRRRRACGGGALAPFLYRSWVSASRHLLEVKWLSAVYVQGSEKVVGEEEGGWMDRARASRGGSRRRRRATIQDLKSSGRGPSRWAIGDAFIPSSGTGVYFGPPKSLGAMGFFQIWVIAGLLVGGAVRRRCCPVFPTACIRLGDLTAVSVFGRVFCAK